MINCNRISRSREDDDSWDYAEAISGLMSLSRDNRIDSNEPICKKARNASHRSSTADETDNHPTSSPFESAEDLVLRSFMSPYRNQPYYLCIPASSFAFGYAPPRSIYDIVRDPSIREIDHYIAEVTYSLMRCHSGVDAEDRVSDMKIGVTLPLFMKECIEYVDAQSITDRNVRSTYFCNASFLTCS
jgi:hypothetical protein